MVYDETINKQEKLIHHQHFRVFRFESRLAEKRAMKPVSPELNEFKTCYYGK